MRRERRVNTASGPLRSRGCCRNVDARGSNVTITVTMITAARGAAVITAGAAIAACAASVPGPAATVAVKRAANAGATPAVLSPTQGARICHDLNAWLAGARHEAKPRFSSQMESDETQAGYSALGNDLMTLDWNLINFNSDALKNSPPDYYPVTGLAALQHDCAGYGARIEAASG